MGFEFRDSKPTGKFSMKNWKLKTENWELVSLFPYLRSLKQVLNK